MTVTWVCRFLGGRRCWIRSPVATPIPRSYPPGALHETGRTWRDVDGRNAPAVNHPLLALTAIVVLGFLAQWTAWRLHLPSILLLLTLGLLLGPGSLLLGLEAPLLDPDLLLGDLLPPLVSLSVAVILFEGGLTLSLIHI